MANDLKKWIAKKARWRINSIGLLTSNIF